MELGLVGLGKIGGNLALQGASKGIRFVDGGTSGGPGGAGGGFASWPDLGGNPSPGVREEV